MDPDPGGLKPADPGWDLILFCKRSFRKAKDPDPCLWLMDPDPGGPKTCRPWLRLNPILQAFFQKSEGSGSVPLTNGSGSGSWRPNIMRTLVGWDLLLLRLIWRGSTGGDVELHLGLLNGGLDHRVRLLDPRLANKVESLKKIKDKKLN